MLLRLLMSYYNPLLVWSTCVYLGACPSILGDYVASAPLTPLLKPDGGVRPIAVGIFWRRLCSKLATTSVCKNILPYLRTYQHGVGVPCGGEAILHAANRLLETKASPKWVEFCYSKPARLYYSDTTLSSAKGVQQGDPLGPLLFALALHPLVLQIAAQCTLDMQAWYLDDGTIVGDTLEVAKALDIIQNEGPKRGLHLNVTKTELFWPTIDPRRNEVGVFPANICKPISGVKLLGGPVSLNTNFYSDMVTSRVDKTIALMQKIQKLHDPQCEILLIRNCAGISKLYFTLRKTNPQALQVASSHYAKHLLDYLRQIIVGDGAGFGLVQQRLATLPIKDGGLGVYTMKDTSTYCYLASYAQTKHLQHTTLQPTSSDFMLSSLPFNERESIIWRCNKTEHAMDFLKVIPITGLNQSVGPRQFQSVLQYRLDIPMFVADSVCSSCAKPMDIYGDHVVHCAKDVGPKYRHDMVRDLISEICYKASIPAQEEVSLGFLSNNDNDLKLADILVHSWEDGKDACFDITGVSPFTGARTRMFTPGQAITAAVTRKNNKYLDKCISNGCGFGVLAFTTLEELSCDFIVFIKRLSNRLASHDVNYKVGSLLFHRLGIIIERGVGAQTVARMPTNHL
ncbi:uncharacterized protein LOC113311927 [Papaver somniferum]|uniref:uncharacterized protein LOC113311927 n=1 Tax=Papaver somniferum TaxID=3469 RepID=UPI000E6FB7A5|nr:uncharacterized protein LOC113311927 [Papaver somniferum]